MNEVWVGGFTLNKLEFAISRVVAFDQFQQGNLNIPRLSAPFYPTSTHYAKLHIH